MVVTNALRSLWKLQGCHRICVAQANLTSEQWYHILRRMTGKTVAANIMGMICFKPCAGDHDDTATHHYCEKHMEGIEFGIPNMFTENSDDN